MLEKLSLIALVTTAACSSGELSDVHSPALSVVLSPQADPTAIVELTPRGDTCPTVGGVEATVGGAKVPQESNGGKQTGLLEAHCEPLRFVSSTDFQADLAAPSLEVTVKKNGTAISMTVSEPCAVRHLDLLGPDGGVVRPGDRVTLGWSAPTVSTVTGATFTGADAGWSQALATALTVDGDTIAFTMPDLGQLGEARVDVAGQFEPPISACTADSCSAVCTGSTDSSVTVVLAGP